MTNQACQSCSEAEAGARLATEHVKHQIAEVQHPDGTKATVLLLPREYRVEPIEPHIDAVRRRPQRRTGTAVFSDLASFVAHACRFKDIGSAVFASRDPEDPSLLCVLDYHFAGGEDVEARWGEHRGKYDFPKSPEWTAWKAANARSISQESFAEFLENRILDVIDPSNASDADKALADTLGCTFASPSQLLALSRGLTVNVNSRIQNATALASGETQMVFTSQHTDEAGKPLRVPGAFLIAIPVFEGGALYKMPVRLRYRVKDAHVFWFYELYRPERIFNDAFNEACSLVAKETGLPVLLGTPED